MIHDVAMNPIQPLAPAGDPKVAVAIEGHGEDLDFASVERGCHEWLDGSFLQLPESQARPFGEHADPHGSVRTKGQAHNAVLSHVGFERFDRIRLRRTVTPVHERGLASEPEPALAVGHYGIDRADRYALCLPQALERGLRDVTESRVRDIRSCSYDPQRPVGILAHVLERRKTVQLEVRRDRPVLDVSDLAAAYRP